MSAELIGFIGLGNMGAPMAANLAKAGHALLCFDAAGTQGRTPASAEAAGSAAAIAERVRIALFSLPDGKISDAVAREMLAAKPRKLEILIDTSTTGMGDAKRLHDVCAKAGIAYVDAPVSGGVVGAKAGTLALMVAAPLALYETIALLLKPMARQVFHVGTRPGQGMAMKLLNNFLSATAMAATSEAIAFGERQGLDMKTMLDIINISTGQNTATSDKFPKRVLPATYDHGFATRLMAKDMRLYLDAVRHAGTPAKIGEPIAALWDRLDTTWPKSDFTEIYPFVRDGEPKGPRR
ncbi:MAG: NAD(P)-dependent oxidoreductase [Alphaproteobacteria bacterium]|nr:NAD(P)-dependent oxidoreductase [Alphaproteobacteria bacterium]